MKYLSLSLKTILYIILFAGFPLFLGAVAYNYNARAESMLALPTEIYLKN